MSACTTCGACCASFRVDFSVFETQEHGGSVPDGLWVEVTDQTARLRGTDHARPRCAALCGKIGEKATCGIYEWRPNPCREFEEGSDACAQTRRRHALAPLGAPFLG
jgi:Fe-S-cluster containining protein